MKTKYFFLHLLTVLLISFSCEDSKLSEIGTSIMPNEDKIKVYENTVSINLKTIKTDSIYAKTINGMLGEYYDPIFGTLNAGYACQFYPAIGFDSTRYITDMIGGKIDSVFLEVYYSYMGDSLAPMELTVYPIVKPLEKNYYTSVNPEEFADMAHPITKFAYTAMNQNIPNSHLYGMLEIPLPAEWGQKYVDIIKNTGNPSVDDFLKMFPGLYLKSTFGSGSLLFVDNSTYSAYTQVVIQYRTKEQGESYLGGDSIRTRQIFWGVTKEVIQINSYKNSNIEPLFQDNSKAYIKSPDGVFTEITIPIDSIVQKIGKRQFSSVKLSLKALPKNDWNFSLNFPGLGYPPATSSSRVAFKLALIQPDSVKNFFEQQQIANNLTSYTAIFSSASYSYNFNNISNLIRYAIDHNPKEDLKLWIIPVQASFTANKDIYGNTDYSTAQDFAISYDLFPTGVALKKDNQTISIIATDLQINN